MIIVGFLLLLGGIIFFIFNKRIGLLFFNNPWSYTNVFLNARQHALLIGFFLLIFGLIIVLDFFYSL